MKTILLVKYIEEDTIEGYVRNEKEFKNWIGNHNMQRIIDGEAPESVNEFSLTEVKLLK